MVADIVGNPEPEGGRIENIWQLFPLSYIAYECTPVLPTLGKNKNRIRIFIFRFTVQCKETWVNGATTV
jgi:hypothetical protein